MRFGSVLELYATDGRPPGEYTWTVEQMYFLKDKTWEEVHSGIFRKVYDLKDLKLGLQATSHLPASCLRGPLEQLEAAWECPVTAGHRGVLHIRPVAFAAVEKLVGPTRRGRG